MASLGEIDIILTRGNITCRLRALVMKNLQADVFGGTTFHDDNDIQGRIKTKQIKIHNKYMVFQTNDALPLPHANQPTASSIHAPRHQPNPNSHLPSSQNNPQMHGHPPISSSGFLASPQTFAPMRLVANRGAQSQPQYQHPLPRTVEPAHPNHVFLRITSALTLYPDTYIPLQTPTRKPNTPTLLVQPDPPLPHVNPIICDNPPPGEPLLYSNPSQHPIHIPAKTTFKCLAINPSPPNQTGERAPLQSPPPAAPSITSDDLNINSNILTMQQINNIVTICNTNKAAFDNNLTTGYNHKAGRHYASLRFKSEAKPAAKTLGMPSYSRKCANLQQAVMDRLEQQGVLAHPQDHGIQVNLVSPSWVLQKGSARNKKLEECTIDELRFVVAFNALNDHLLPQPSKPSSAIKALKFLARWKYFIFADLNSSYYQIHLAKKDWAWTGVMTPFRGVRVLTRTGQGLLNSEAELDELLERVLGHHIASGICEIARDDIQVGGDTIDQAIHHWDLVLSALNNSNLKVTAKKVRFFPQQTEVYGWKYHLDGTLSPSDHVLTTLGQTDLSTLKTVKAVNSWRGLYKTLLPSLPNLAAMMDPFDKATAQLQSQSIKEFHWSPQLVAAFNTAQDQLRKTQPRVLPKPEEQLLLQPDGAQSPPCIGWCLFVLRQINGANTPIPVQFASAKLNNYMMHWKPCEIEAVAAATAIDQCAHWIMESDKPTIVCPDSKAVVQATERMKKGQMSTNPRLQTILACINRRPVLFYHSSAKLGQHLLSDTCSRTDTTCKAADCAIERFLQEIPANIQLMSALVGNTTLWDLTYADTEPCISAALAAATSDNLNSHGMLPIGSPDKWKTIQHQHEDTQQVIHLLRTGDSPRRQNSSPAVNRFFKHGQLENGLLVVKSYDQKLLKTTNKIIVPTGALPMILTTIHNKTNHPTRHQMLNIINRYFFTSGLEHHIDDLYAQCTVCAANKRIHRDNSRHTSKETPTTPGTYMNADIIKRAGQMILVMMDLVTHYVTTAFLQAETKQAIAEAITATSTPIRLSSNLFIRTDRAPALQSLAKDTSGPLTSIGITLQMPNDEFNKNANCHVDRAIQQLQEEIRKISPEGKQLTHVELAKATLHLNHRIRNTGLTAAEAHFLRDAASLAPLPQRTKTPKPPPPTPPSPKPPQIPPKPPYQPGETVFIKSQGTKNQLRHPFLITSSVPPHLTVRKILHAYTNNPKLSHVQQQTSSHSVYPASFSKPFKTNPLPTPVSIPPPNTLSRDSDSDSEYEDDPTPPLPPPSPPPSPPLPPPIQVHRNLLTSFQSVASAPARNSIIPQLLQIQQESRERALASALPPQTPPPLADPTHTPPRPVRQAKIRALAQLRPPIPQLEGAEPTPDTSFYTPSVSPTHPLSPGEPWSPIPQLLPDDQNASFTSTSSIWSGQDRLSLAWDSPTARTPSPTPWPPPHQHPSPPLSPIFKAAQREAFHNRRHSFAGFQPSPWPRKPKICGSRPDYSVWNRPVTLLPK